MNPNEYEAEVFVGRCELSEDEIGAIAHMMEAVIGECNDENSISHTALGSHPMFHYFLTLMKRFCDVTKDKPVSWPDKWPDKRNEIKELNGKIGPVFDYGMNLFAAGVKYREFASEEARRHVMEIIRKMENARNN
ncbi:MAG: hypothetical protein Q8P23_01255 [bacterium]|nr:hypothetical protein [bacterium]